MGSTSKSSSSDTVQLELDSVLNSTKSSLRSGVLPVCIAAAAGLLLIPLSSFFFAPDEPPKQVASPSAPPIVANNSFEPLPLTDDLDPRIVQLGEKLFHDPRLSSSGEIACASCHIVTEGGDDNLTFSIGHDGQTSSLNAPTVLNSRFNFRQFWDGRAGSLETQIDGPLQHSSEMNSTWQHVLTLVRDDNDYRRRFQSIFDRTPTSDDVRRAIAEYERSLTTPNSRFDEWLRGSIDLTDDELRGYEIFVEYQCTSCHQGINVGGNMYQRLGVMVNYFSDRREIRKADLGRFNFTGKERDRHVFKVPTLRNVELTAPYFHDGSASTLEDAVKAMIHYQLGRPVIEEDVRMLVEFLKTLTGTLAKG